MSRIYFDSQVYSNLRRNIEPRYQKLNLLLEEYKENLVFLFSYAHILDKRKDSSDYKFEDFQFMESFTKDNYIAYHPIEHKVSQYLATPLTVFDDYKDEDVNLESILDAFKDLKDDPTLSPYMALMDSLMNTSIMKSSDFSAFSKEELNMIRQYIPLDNDDITLKEIFLKQIDVYNDLMTRPASYKEMRTLVDQAINNGKITLNNNDIDWSSAFENTMLKKSFFEYVEDSLKSNSNKQIYYYDFYLQAYFCLDMLGVSKDKLSGKNTFSNISNDGLHSYFGQYSDFIVSEDKRSVAKSRALYNHFDISAKILTVDEFIDLLPAIAGTTDPTMPVFFEKLSTDIRQGIRIGERNTQNYIQEIQIGNRYFNFFDELFELGDESGAHYILSKKKTHELASPSYRECGMILKHCLSIFGRDMAGVGSFDFDRDIKDGDCTWKTRHWRIGSFVGILDDKMQDRFCFTLMNDSLPSSSK